MNKINKKQMVSALSVLLAIIFVLSQTGCTASGSITDTVTCVQGQGYSVSVVGHGQITWKRSELQSGSSSSAISSYNLIFNVPSSNLTLNTQSPSQATLTATTDTGYTTSLTVTLQPTTSTTAPVADGYTVYTFALPNSSDVSDWPAVVNQNTNDSVTITSSNTALFDSAGNSGTWMIYLHVNSEQTGPTPVGSISYSDPGNPGGCSGSGSGRQCTS